MLVLLAPAALATPALRGEVQRPECRAAQEMAQAAWRATSPVLIWPMPQPDPATATVVLHRADRDISGGDGIRADPTVFQPLRIHRFDNRLLAADDPAPGAALHWQRRAQDGWRLAVLETEFSWRGSWYWLFRLPDSLSPEAFAQGFRDASRTPALRDSVPPPLLYSGSWATPTLLRDTESGRLWLLEQGHFVNDQTEWRVHLPLGAGFQTMCSVQLGLDAAAALAQLPAEVRRFARLADQALGPGRGAAEGTLQPTQAIRNRVALDFSNLAQRPWALSDPPVNSRAEVEAGLVEWARRVPARQQLRRALLASLPPAEAALAEYLAQHFALSAPEAATVSRHAIDHLLRRHFTFARPPGAQRHLPSPSPWPVDLR